MTNEQLLELTRRGGNICNTCGKPKEIYYKPWCPYCEKPVVEQVPVFNLLMCLKHIAVVNGLSYEHLIDKSAKVFYDFGNDRYLYFSVVPIDEREEFSEDYLYLHDLLVNTFELGQYKYCLFNVSW